MENINKAYLRVWFPASENETEGMIVIGMKMKRVLPVVLLALLFTACAAPVPTTRPIGEASVYTIEPPTETPAEPPPTKIPTETPIPPTPTPIPEPVIFEGTGDTILDFDAQGHSWILHITGNACSSYFGITSLDADNDYIDLLVNAVEPYDGIRPLDFMDGEWTRRFEVQASCDWTIAILPLALIPRWDVPGTIEGTGDDVFAITGETPDLAHITGNDCGSYFGVHTIGSMVDLLVNEVDPYDGTSIVESEAVAFIVQASCPWMIEITAK